MAIEIERRFLVSSGDWWTASTRSRLYRQSFLSKTGENSVRVRWAGEYGVITVKGPREGLARDEFEYRIPAAEADYLLSHLCVTPIIEKIRHWVDHAGLTWEVDVYQGAAAGLVLAEVELDRSDQPFVLPRWAGKEVTHDLRYRSAGVARGLWRDLGVRRRKVPAVEPAEPSRLLTSRGVET